MNTRAPRKVRKHTASCGLLLLLAVLSGCALLGGQRNEPVRQAVEQAPQTLEPPAQAVEPPAQAVKPVQTASKPPEVIPPEPPKPEQPLPTNHSQERNKRGRPYQVKGKTYHPLLTAHGYEEKGIASWYGPSFQGHRTSCGEVFDMYKPSAAHKLLPMHTRIRVTNLENGKSLTLRVNDRGPFVPGRVLELSYAAAKALAMVDKGLARVLIRTSGPVEGQHAHDLRGEFCVYVGSFDTKTDALLLLKEMKSLRYKVSKLKAVKADRDGEAGWRVEVGPYKSMSDAQRAKSTVVRDFPSAFIVAKE